MLEVLKKWCPANITVSLKVEVCGICEYIELEAKCRPNLLTHGLLKSLRDVGVRSLEEKQAWGEKSIVILGNFVC